MIKSKKAKSKKAPVMGRPKVYRPKFCSEVDKYLKERRDEEIEVLKQRGDKGEVYENKLKVKLPTIENFAFFLGVHKDTLYEWAKEYKDFSDALDKIRQEQFQRLVDNSLAGSYNPTIAKLMLSSNHGLVERSDHTTDGKKIEGNTIIFNDFGKTDSE